MVDKGAQVLFGIWIKPVVKQLGDNFPFNSQGAGRNVHHMVEASVEVLLIYRQIGNSRHIDCDDADGTGTLS